MKLLLLLLPVCVFSQSVTLDNFATYRINTLSTPNIALWDGQDDAIAGSVTTCSVPSAGALACTAQPQGSGTTLASNSSIGATSFTLTNATGWIALAGIGIGFSIEDTNTESFLCTTVTGNVVSGCAESPGGGGAGFAHSSGANAYPVPNGVGVYLLTCNGNNSGCYNSIGSYVQSWLTSGTWSSSINRMSFSFSCATKINGYSNGMGDNLNIGTYVRNLLEPMPSESGQGQHYYSSGNANCYPNHKVFAQYNECPNHVVGDFGARILPCDPEWVVTSGSPSPDCGGSVCKAHYYDGMTHFYFTGAYKDACGSLPVVPSCSSTLNFFNTTLSVYPWTLSVGTTNEPDAWIKDVLGTYNGAAYEVSWDGVPTQAIPSGQNSINVKVYWANASMHANGLSSAAGSSNVSGPGGTPEVNVTYTTANMAEASTKYFAFVPTMPIAGVTNDTPAIVSLFNDTGLQSGAGVTVANLAGSVGTALNGTWNVTPVSRFYARFLDGNLTSLVSNSSGIIVVTTPSAHGLTAGRAINISNSGSCSMDGSAYPYIITAVTSTTFTLGPTMGTNNVTCTSSSSGASGLQIWTYDAVSLNGSTASGVYTSGILTGSGAGTMTATSNTANFTEVAIPAGGLTCGITQTSLPAGTVGTSYSQTLTNNGFCGSSTLTWTVSSGSLPTGLSGCSSVTGTSCAITGTPTTTTGSPFSFTIHVTDGGSNTGSEPYSVTINPSPAIIHGVGRGASVTGIGVQ